MFYLDSNHTHFVLVEITDKDPAFGDEIDLRAKLVNHMSGQRAKGKYEEVYEK